MRAVQTQGSRRRVVLTLAVAAVAVLAAGCASEVVDGRAVSGAPSGSTAGPSGGSSSSPSQPTGTLTWGEGTGTVANLMPLIAEGNSTANGNLVVRVLDGLYRSSPSLAYIPDDDQGSATSTVVGGQQIVDIKINPAAVWADGQPVTADDYAFTISTQRSADPSAGGCAALLSTTGYDQVERTEKVGDKELKVYFRTPFADWKGLFSGNSAPVLSKHVLDKGSATATCAEITRGWPVSGGIPLGAQNGPWLLTAANVDAGARTITLVPNPRYWGDKPKLAKLVYKTIDSDSDAQLTALRDNSVDVIYPQPQLDLVSNLKQLTGITSEVSFGSSYEHLDFNSRDPLLKYPQIRQAIALAIDRPALTSATVGRFSDRATPLGNRLLLNSQRGYVDNSGQYARPNVARAKQLIESVGGKLGADGIYRVGGRPLTFRVMTTQGNALRDMTISRLAAQVRPAGVALTEFANPDIFEGSDRATSLASFGFQIALFAWVGSPSLSSSTSIYRSTGGQNYSRGGTPGIDSALQRLTTATDATAQIAAANEADRALWTQMLTLPLYQKPTLLAYRDTVSGLKDNPSLAGPLWNSDDVTVK